MKRPIALAFVAALCAILATTSAAITVRITDDGTGDLPDIQTALNTCATGDSILVAPGVFHERIVWPATDGLILIGETTPEECIIDGMNSHRPISIISTVGPTTVIAGLTIRNGDSLGYGGAIWCGAGSAPTITRNVIENNTCGSGGGIGCNGGSAPLIENNLIRNNHAFSNYGGGGVGVFFGSAATITGNQIIGNTSIYGAGIIVTDNCDVTITDNLIEGNHASSTGGGILLYGNPIPIVGLITGNEIRGNTAQSTAGIRLYDGLDVVVRDNLVIANTSAISTGGITITGTNELATNVTIQGNLIIENRGPETGGINIRDASPLIASNLIRDNIGDGIRSTNGGNPLIIHNDIHGHGIYFGVRNDDPTVTIMAEDNWWGANSGPYHATANPGGTGDGVSDHVDFEPWDIVSDGGTPDANATPVLHQNQPNPFNPATTIAFTVPSAQQIRLTVHAMDGRLVATLVDAWAEVGRNEVIWNGQTNDGRILPSGVYFYRLTGGEFSRTNRMVLVR